MLEPTHPELGTCWQFTGTATPYGRIAKAQDSYTHRLGWKLLLGPIPEGKELHHRCRTCLRESQRRLRSEARRDQADKSDVLLITRPNRHTGRRSTTLERLLDRLLTAGCRTKKMHGSSGVNTP